jgi:hypothetical protein
MRARRSDGLAPRQIPNGEHFPTTMTISKIAASVAIAALLSVAALAQINPLGGRLTLVSNTPVMTSDVTGASATTVYYTPYVSNLMPYNTGAGVFTNSSFTQMSLPLNSTYQTAGNIYDIFEFRGVICTGPAWSGTNPLTSRGSGAGTTELTQSNGLWVNAYNIVCSNASTPTYNAQTCLYLGSIYMTANGETSMVFNPSAAAGGSANVLGLYNAYNRVTLTSTSSDSTSSWTYSTGTWRPENNSTSNSVTFLDGLQQSSVRSTYTIDSTVSSVGVFAGIGVDLDYTSGASPVKPIGFSDSTSINMLTAYGWFTPQLGLHSVQAVEYGGGSTVTFAANGVAFNGLTVVIEM